MIEFKSFETYNVKLSEIAFGSFKVPKEHQSVVEQFSYKLISEILLMRKDVVVEFRFNLNLGNLYFGLSKSFPFIVNDFHEFVYPLNGKTSIAEVIDDVMSDSGYYKTSLPIEDFNDMFKSIKLFDDLFEFDGQFYNHIKKSSFSYNNMGYKDVFNGINLIRIFGHSPGVSIKMNGMSINVNNSCWIFDFDGVNLNIKKEQFQKPDSSECIKNTLLGLYNLSKGTSHKDLSFLK